MIAQRLVSLITACSAILVTACGGSSSSPPPPPPPPPPPSTATLPITADNAGDITAAVLDAVVSATDLVDIADVVGLPIASGPGPGAMKPGDVHTMVTDCDTGSITTAWDDADNDLAPSTGDMFTTTFDMCFFQDDGVTIDGQSSVTDVVVTGDPFTPIAPYAFSATFGFADLVANDPLETVTIDGDLDIDLGSEDGIVISAELGTASLSVDIDGVMESLTDYVMTQVIDQNALTQDISAAGTYTSDVLEGSVTFETLQNFFVMGLDSPSSGQLLISDDTSSVLVTVLDNMNVRLEVDTNLDGTIDATIDVTWGELNIG
jgi:hypothetical protein